MKHTWIIALVLGLTPVIAAPPVVFAQSSTFGSQGGAVIPGSTGHKRPADSSAGSPASEPATSLSERSAANSNTREGDVPRQIALLLPAAIILTLILVGGLYWFVFRKATTPEGEAASKGTPIK